jgi:predicted nuclease of predicted toxin-antitoxin system
MPRTFATSVFEATRTPSSCQRAVSEARVLVTGDLDFANTLTVPLGSHSGILVARLANEVPVATVNAVILGAITSLAAEDVTGCLVIVELTRVRIRRPPRP